MSASKKIARQLLVILIIVSSNKVFAEAPAITSFFPAGLQRRATAEFKINGKPGTQPVKVWSETDQLSHFQLNEKGDVLTLTANSDARPGIHWIRFYNSDGATSQLPIYVGALEEISEKEPNNSVDQAEAIESLPITINGVLHKSGEVDTFLVSLKKDEQFVASIDALEALGSPMDSVLQILDENGFVIMQNDDDHGFDPLLKFTVPHDGKFLVRVFCFPATPNSTINFAGGSNYIYRLTLTTEPFQLIPVLEETPSESNSSGLDHYFRVLSEHQSIIKTEGQVEKNSLPHTSFDVLNTPERIQKTSLQLKKGDALRIQVLARQIASLLDPVLTIRKPDGSILKETDDTDREKRDIDYAWTAPADGEYTFEVTDRYQHAGDRYFSTLLISNNLPRLVLSVDADHFEAKRDKPLEIPITVTRDAGFKDIVKVQLKDPPPGLTFEEVTSEEKGDSAKKVTLKLNVKEAEPFQGPIQIIGIFGEEKQETSAIAALKVMNQKTSAIWLTIPEKPKEPKDEAGN